MLFYDRKTEKRYNLNTASYYFGFMDESDCINGGLEVLDDSSPRIDNELYDVVDNKTQYFDGTMWKIDWTITPKPLSTIKTVLYTRTTNKRKELQKTYIYYGDIPINCDELQTMITLYNTSDVTSKVAINYKSVLNTWHILHYPDICSIKTLLQSRLQQLFSIEKTHYSNIAQCYIPEELIQYDINIGWELENA